MLNKKNCWGFLDSGFNDGSYNMAVDEVMLAQAVAKVQTFPVLRIYGFYRKTLTLGYGQKIKEVEGLQGYREQGYELCRRITGGGAVFHGEDLTYSLVVPIKSNPDFASTSKSYRLIHSAIQEGLRQIKIESTFSTKGSEAEKGRGLCFESPVKDDLMIGGRKLSGACQKRAADYLLHQGSIDLMMLSKSNEDFFELFRRVKNAVLDGFKKTLGVDFILIDFSLKELEEAHRLAQEKYQALSWNSRV